MTISPLHSLLLLSDSALPLGSFAFSSGLESFLAHKKHDPSSQKTASGSFATFLNQSLQNVASTALPYVLTAYHNPRELENLDNDFDASTPCTVARRASVAQGRALVAVWERALTSSLDPTSATNESRSAVDVLISFSTSLKSNQRDEFGLLANAHFAPLFGTVCCALRLGDRETAYVFLLNHAKAVLSAAVRASVIGPYQSQAMLASAGLQGCIEACITLEKSRKAADAAVTVPTMDLWMGRHDLLYSRIFNS